MADIPKKQKPGGNFYNTQHYRVGKLFFRQVRTAAKEGKLLYTDAYKLISLYGKTFSHFENVILACKKQEKKGRHEGVESFKLTNSV